MKRDRSEGRQGFTLIEVLLVLVILVVLASLAVVAVAPIRRGAMEKAAKVNTYQLDVGTYPANLQALRQQPGDLPDPSKWHGPYIDRNVPLDPWDHQYNYAQPGQHNTDGFDISCTTPEGKLIGNWDDK
jgi:general secretion pathway protein G